MDMTRDLRIRCRARDGSHGNALGTDAPEHPENLPPVRPIPPAMTRIVLTFAAALAAVLALAPAASAGPRLNAGERAVIQRLNEARAQHGLQSLRPAWGLNRAADRHSRDMLAADFFDHPSSDGTPFDERVRRFARAGIVGETLASLPDRSGGAATVIDIWMNSPAHRAIVLDPRLKRVGLAKRWGRLGSTETAVVTADFAS
jgi:uncharacterized protein YkwD